MNILPSVIIQLLENFRPLMRVEVFETFILLITGLLVGEAKHGTVRSSVFAPADYQPARISDFFTTHRVSPQKMMAKLTELVLRSCHNGALFESTKFGGKAYEAVVDIGGRPAIVRVIESAGGVIKTGYPKN